MVTAQLWSLQCHRGIPLFCGLWLQGNKASNEARPSCVSSPFELWLTVSWTEPNLVDHNCRPCSSTEVLVSSGPGAGPYYKSLRHNMRLCLITSHSYIIWDWALLQLWLTKGKQKHCHMTRLDPWVLTAICPLCYRAKLQVIFTYYETVPYSQSLLPNMRLSRHPYNHHSLLH